MVDNIHFLIKNDTVYTNITKIEFISKNTPPCLG